MKHLSNLLGLVIMLFAVACSSPTEDTQSVVLSSTDLVEATRGHESAEDFNLQFARKWESGSTYVDLKIDGTFEANIDDQPIEGTWNISEDQKKLQLNESVAGEGKGRSFNATYIITAIDATTMKVLDKSGNELAFSAK